MDFLGGHGRKFSEDDDDENPGMTSDVLSSETDGDSFATSMGMGVDTFCMEDPEGGVGPGDWFHSVFGEQGLVYNDRNLGETASHQPAIKAEHSYSVCNLGPPSPASPSSSDPLPLNLIKMEDDHTCGMALDLTHKDGLTHPSSSTTTTTTSHNRHNHHHRHHQRSSSSSSSGGFRLDTLDPSDHFLMTSHAPSTLTLTRSANILLTSASASATTRRHRVSQAGFGSTTVATTFPCTDDETAAAANIQIKTEPMDSFEERTVNMPPTPPSSNGSDSEGSQSPQCSAPSSPQRQSPLRVYHYHSYTPHHHHHQHHHDSAMSSSDDCLSAALSQPLFLSPVPQSGVLILTEEEKRTLMSEGYPVPCRLPLTKQEEKNLKKVRRKIKNKISAQESRRKKKEYVEALEKRMEVYSHENSDLRKKLDCLENNNRSLLSQLHRLQTLVAKLPKGANSSNTSTTSSTTTSTTSSTTSTNTNADLNKPGLVLT